MAAASFYALAFTFVEGGHIRITLFLEKASSSYKKFLDSFVLNRISPIQTNKGRAVNVHDDEAPQIVVAIASPTGLVVNNIIPIVETPIILIATQTPDPRKNKSTLIKNIMRNISVILA